MSPSWEKISELLDAVLARPPEDRSAFLREATGGDEELLAEVLSLLAADEGAEVFFDKPLLEGRHRDPEAGEAHLAERHEKRRRRDSQLSHANGRRFPPGTVWNDRYRIGSLLARGEGSETHRAETYRAEDLARGLTVALQFLPPTLAADPATLADIRAKVERARRIVHPNVCRVHDLGEVDGHPILSTDYVDGESLASLWERVGVPVPEKALELAKALADGLEALHHGGVIHAGLAASNVLLDDRGRLRLADYCLPLLPGTTEYLAPELLAGAEPTVGSDLHALGRLLRGLVTGLDDDLDAILDRCLEPDPAARPDSARLVAFVTRSATARRAASKKKPHGAEALPAGEGDETRRASPSGWQPSAGESLPGRPHWVLVGRHYTGEPGDVWLVHHRKTGERRRLKLCSTASEKRTLEREIAIFQRLRDRVGEREDLVRILDWSLDETPSYLETEYTEGGDLREWAEGRGGLTRIALDVRLRLILQVTETLAAVHSAGIVHRDLRPSNLLIARDTDGGPRARLTSFRLARMAGPGAHRRPASPQSDLETDPLSGSFTGDRHLYLAPEGLEGRPATTGNDVYALGVLLYQMIVGDLSRPITPDWRDTVADELLAEDLAIMLERRPNHRPSAAELAERLRTLESRRATRERERPAGFRKKVDDCLSHWLFWLVVAALASAAVVRWLG